jgi:hypothetical protein
MAIEQIVDAYVRLKDGRALLDLRAHRHHGHRCALLRER